MVHNIKQSIMWSYEVWSELDAQIVRNCWRVACILPATWNVDFALVDEREKNITPSISKQKLRLDIICVTKQKVRLMECCHKQCKCCC